MTAQKVAADAYMERLLESDRHVARIIAIVAIGLAIGFISSRMAG